MIVSLKRKGTLEARMKECAKRYYAKVGDANHAAYEHLLNESRPLVPRDTGALADSGGIRTQGTGRNRTTTVFYGPNDNIILTRTNLAGKQVKRYPRMYARLIHFNLNNVALRSGISHFLSKPLEEQRFRMQQIVREVVKR